MDGVNLSKYENLIKEEDDLIKKIETCEECIGAIFSLVYSKAESIHVAIVKNIINTIHIIGKDLQIELLHLIFEKKILASKIDTDKPRI